MREVAGGVRRAHAVGWAAAAGANGYLPAREILTAVGPVQVRVPRWRDRLGPG